jgi:triosephosphate isomerase
MIMRKPLIAGNWKMNTTIEEAVQLVRSMTGELDSIKGVEKLLCPPFVSLQAVKDIISGTSIMLGAQNMYFKEKGAYTGEISPLMLKGLCSYIVLGHSERRQYFNETDEIINSKVKSAMQFAIIPILCVGESLIENEAGRTEEIVSRQVKKALNGIRPYDALVIAYEPVWAIGTGKAASAKQANDTIKLIRDIVRDIWAENIGNAIRILYGGSVTAANIAEYIAEPDIDGALVGGASLKADEFITITRRTAEIKAYK